MKKIALLAIISLITLVGFIACTEIQDVPPEEPAEIEESSTDSLVEELRFDSQEEVEGHFLELWREQYRTRNGYEPSEGLQILKTYVSGMFQTHDGKIVSRGSLPYETMAILEKYGTFSGVEDTPECLYQIVGTDSGIIYDAMTSNFQFFYSGNRLDNLLEDLNAIYPQEDASILCTTELKYLILVVNQPVEYAKRAANW